MKRRVQNKISERFCGHSKRTQVVQNITDDCTARHAENPKGEYSNEFREGIIEVAIGGVCVVYGSPSVRVGGGGVLLQMG